MRVWRKASASIGMSNCVEVARPEWRKAAASGSSSGCVEVRGWYRQATIGVRDSKLGDSSPVLEVGAESFAAFIGAAKSGAYDLAG